MLVLALLVLYPTSLKSQMVSVTGKVTDQLTGSLIRDLTVLEKNSGIGTISAFDGSFSLLLKPGEVELNFFSERYELSTVSFTLKNDTTFHVPMHALEADRFKRGRKEGPREENSGSLAENRARNAKSR